MRDSDNRCYGRYICEAVSVVISVVLKWKALAEMCISTQDKGSMHHPGNLGQWYPSWVLSAWPTSPHLSGARAVVQRCPQWIKSHQGRTDWMNSWSTGRELAIRWVGWVWQDFLWGTLVPRHCRDCIIISSGPRLKPCSHCGRARYLAPLHIVDRTTWCSIWYELSCIPCR